MEQEECSLPTLLPLSLTLKPSPWPHQLPSDILLQSPMIKFTQSRWQNQKRRTVKQRTLCLFLSLCHESWFVSSNLAQGKKSIKKKCVLLLNLFQFPLHQCTFVAEVLRKGTCESQPLCVKPCDIWNLHQILLSSVHINKTLQYIESIKRFLSSNDFIQIIENNANCDYETAHVVT